MSKINNTSKECLLICGAFTSANFYVMLSVIRSLDNVHIHAISANNESNTNLPNYDDVTYYHIHNWRLSFLKSMKKRLPQVLYRGIEFLFSKSTALYDNYFSSSYERRIYRECTSIINQYNIDAVFSVCLRFYTHRIASRLHSELNIRWYQFWVDPFCNREGRKRSLWYKGAARLENRFLKDASVIYALPEVFVGSEIIPRYKQKLVTFEIPYLINREVESKTTDIIFAGAFIKNVRDPYPVLDLLLSILNDIDSAVLFHFYVRNKELYVGYDVKSEGRLCFHDYIGHEELSRLLSDSYMLLNIGNAGSIQMPSKTVEYVSYRKPLLFFYKDKDDASLRYLKNYPDICRICVDDELEDNRKKLINFLTDSHSPISYETLMQYKEFRESTPEYIRSQLEL